jgi:hypothetical protein
MYRELAMFWTVRYSNTCRRNRFFFSLKVQTCSGAYPVSCSTGTGVLSGGGGGVGGGGYMMLTLGDIFLPPIWYH